MRRVRKGFFGVDIPLFDGMLVPRQAHDVEDAAEDEDDVNEVSAKPTSPLPMPATPPPPPQPKHIPSLPQAETAQPSPPPQTQPSQTDEISMTLLNQLLETCDTLTKQVANLEQDKVAQAMEITKLKQRVKSKLDLSSPLHLHPNDSATLTAVSMKLKGTENYQVWSCIMLLALKGKNKTRFIDGSCRRSNTDEVLGRQ
nr:ribonuclease H-like domain-containing protein [Tanacetum cinerariifolium]